MAHNDFTKHEQTVQELQNRGFDPTFDVPAVEVLGYDDGGNALRRIAVDANGKLELTANVDIDTTGLATSAKQDTGNTSVASIDTKTPVLGQALATASVPVVLPAAQITTLTPPAAITGFALETGGNLATIAGKDFATQTTLAAINAKLVTGTDIGDVTINNSTGAAAVNIQDGGNTITVDGTVTANLSATDNAVLDNIDADTSAIQTAVELIDDAIKADDAAFTPATTKVMMAGFEADETTTDSVDEGDAGAARMTLDRKQIVTIQPHTAGGWSVMNATSGDTYTALTSTAQVIKASAGNFGGYYIYNPNTAAIYVHVYNIVAASVTVGTSTATLTFCIPAGAAANLELVNGISFSTAMSWAATTTGGGSTAPTTALEAMCWYK